MIAVRGMPGNLLVLATTAWAFTAAVVLVGQGLQMKRRLDATASRPAEAGQGPR